MPPLSISTGRLLLTIRRWSFTASVTASAVPATPVPVGGAEGRATTRLIEENWPGGWSHNIIDLSLAQRLAAVVDAEPGDHVLAAVRAQAPILIDRQQQAAVRLWHARECLDLGVAADAADRAVSLRRDVRARPRRDRPRPRVVTDAD